uniref:NSP3 n=1 Tax=Crocidura shantungensis seadorna-like virus 2 TaxID=3139546 RepID=A0AB38ZK61_9REOV
MADLTKSMVENVLKANNISLDVINSVKNAFDDSGLSDSLNNWKDAYYQKRIPKTFSHYTLSQQLHNLETEVYLLRSDKYLEGINRHLRTMNSFKIEKNEKDHTVLIPTNRLSQIILANTFSDNFNLPAAASVNVENLIKECRDFELKSDVLEKKNNLLKERVKYLETQLNTLDQMHASQIKLINEMTKNIKSMVTDSHNKGVIIERLTKEVNNYKSMLVDDENELDYREDLIRMLASQLGWEVDLIERQYVRDLTREGIESNPGPNTYYNDLYSFLLAINLKIKHHFSFDLKDKDIHIVKLECEELGEYDYWETDEPSDIEKHCFHTINAMLNRHEQYLIESRCDHDPSYIKQMISHINYCSTMMMNFSFFNITSPLDLDFSILDESDNESYTDEMLEEMERSLDRMFFDLW